MHGGHQHLYPTTPHICTEKGVLNQGASEWISCKAASTLFFTYDRSTAEPNLTECCAVGMQATDSTFGAKLRENLHSNGRFRFDPKKPNDDFVVEHYAGPVIYSCTKFLDKNKDTLSTGALPNS